jgi:hypothetical protein
MLNAGTIRYTRLNVYAGIKKTDNILETLNARIRIDIRLKVDALDVLGYEIATA